MPQPAGAAGAQGARSVPRYLTGPGPIGGNKVWLILAKQGPNSARPAVSCCLCQMVAAYFRFPLGVYALTTARSTGTSQISDDFIEGIEFEAVSIASSLPAVICGPNPRQQLGASASAIQYAFTRSRLECRPRLILRLNGPPGSGYAGSGGGKSTKDRTGTGPGTHAKVRVKVTPRAIAAQSNPLALGYFP